MKVSKTKSSTAGVPFKKLPPELATPITLRSTPKTRQSPFGSWRIRSRSGSDSTPRLWGRTPAEKAGKEQKEEEEQKPRVRRASTLDGPEGEWSFRSGSVDVEAICSRDSQLTGEAALSAVRSLRLLALDHRYRLANRVLERLEALVRGGQQPGAEEVRAALEERAMSELVETVRRRNRAVEEAICELDKADDWIECAHMLGVTTYYKFNPDRTITIKMTGESRGSLFNQVAVLREGAFYRKWLPMCSDSRMLHSNKCEALMYLLLSSPVLTRDALLCVYAVDLADQGSVLFLGDPDGLPAVPRPDPPRGYSAGRMDIRDFRFKIDVTGPDSIQSTLIAVFDPRAAIPTSILNFATKRIAGAFLALIKREAQRVAADPLNHPVAQRMRSDPFYRLYLVPRMQQYYASRHWAFPPVEALELLLLDDDDQTPPPTPLFHPPRVAVALQQALSADQSSPEDRLVTPADEDRSLLITKAEAVGRSERCRRWGEAVLLLLMVGSLLAMLAFRLAPLLYPIVVRAAGIIIMRGGKAPLPQLPTSLAALLPE